MDDEVDGSDSCTWVFHLSPPGRYGPDEWVTGATVTTSGRYGSGTSVSRKTRTFPYVMGPFVMAAHEAVDVEHTASALNTALTHLLKGKNA